jgi:YggT family protein
MARAVDFLVNTIVSVVLFFFLMRLLLQLSRADFRNPIAKGMMQLTNWLVMPLRKLIPPVGRFDTASLIAVLLVAGAGIGLSALILASGLPPLDGWLLATLRSVLDGILWIYLLSLLIGVVISWVAPDGYSPAHQLVHALNEPLLRPLRSILPPMGGFDFSSLVALLLIQFVRILLGL